MEWWIKKSDPPSRAMGPAAQMPPSARPATNSARFPKVARLMDEDDMLACRDPERFSYQGASATFSSARQNSVYPAAIRSSAMTPKPFFTCVSK